MIDAYVVMGVRAYRDAVAQALQASGRVRAVGGASHPAAAMGEVASLGRVIVLLDHPGPNGPAWARDLTSAATSARIVVMGLSRAEAEVGAWAQAGVVGYTGIDATLEDVVRAVERAGARSWSEPAAPVPPIRVVRPRPDMVVDLHALDRQLTTREHEVMRLVGEGYSNQQIARRLCIALGTVKNHIHNVLEKLDVQSRLEAVNAVRRVGFVRWHDEGPMFADHAAVGIGVSVAAGSD